LNNLGKKYEIEKNDPLGVLLNLLDKNHLEISNFSLAQVADQYLDYLNKTKNQSEILENISEFIWVASSLALLKSKILLASVEIEEVLIEEKSDLKDRLTEYKKFKKISDEVRTCFKSPGKLFTRKNKEIFETAYILNATYSSTNQISNLMGFEMFSLKYELCYSIR
jgi:chromatin segregation and condensation protein Rec8/ScpA/Scc1 (kleisin family)